MTDILPADYKAKRQDAVNARNRGDIAAARAIYRDIVQEHADNPRIIEITATTLAKMACVDDAVAILEEQLARLGDRQKLLSQLAHILMAAQRWEAASAVLRRWLVLAWEDNVALMLAHSLVMSDALEEAEAVLQKVIAADATNAEALLHLATVQHKRGNFMEALAAIDNGLDKDPRPLGYCLRAEILLQLNQPTLANIAYQRALELAPEYEPAMKGLAGISAAKKKPMPAYGQRIRVYDPAHGGSHYIGAAWVQAPMWKK